MPSLYKVAGTFLCDWQPLAKATAKKLDCRAVVINFFSEGVTGYSKGGVLLKGIPSLTYTLPGKNFEGGSNPPNPPPLIAVVPIVMFHHTST